MTARGLKPIWRESTFEAIRGLVSTASGTKPGEHCIGHLYASETSDGKE